MSTRHAWVVLLALAAVVSCRPDDQRTDTLDASSGMKTRDEMDPAVVSQLDSGSAAYRAHDFEGSLLHYRRVTELDEDVAAGWFGVYMAERALGNGDEAEAALERARSAVPGATMLRGENPPR